MKKNEYQKRIEDWLSYRETDIGPKESFRKTEGGEGALQDASLCYVKWLVLPGEEAEAGMPVEAALEWNRILFSVFSRTKDYRQEEERLWDRLQRLSFWLRTYLKEEEQGFSLIGGSVPKLEQTLIGRTREIELTAKRLREEGAVFLYGIGGIGKSAVARAYAHLYAKQYNTVVYASCEGKLRELFADDQRIPVRHMAYAPDGKRSEMGWYVRRKLNALRKTVDERTLLVIDNFDQVRDSLLERVLSLPCHILITTRTDPAYFGKSGIEIRALEDQNERLALFSAYYGELREDEKEAVALLLDRFGGHTLYTKLLAGYCHAEQLCPSQLLSAPDVPKAAIFGLSALSWRDQRILKNAVLLPVAGMERERFWRLSGSVKADAVSMLVGRGLVEYDAGREWISLHPLVRKEVIESLGVSWQDCREFAGNLKMELSGFWDMTMKEKMGCLPYVMGILETLPLTDAHSMDIIFALTDLLWQMGQWSYALRRTKALYEECRRAFGCPHPHTARAAHLAASVYHNQRKKEEAVLWHERAYLAYRDCPRKDARAEGLYLTKYNRCFALKKEYEQADRLLRKAEALYLAEIEANHDIHWMKSDLQNTYVEHTRLCMAQGKYEEALRWCKRADELCESLGGSKATKVYILHDEAVIRLQLGDAERAGMCLEEAFLYAREYMSEDQPERLEVEKEWQKKERGKWG